MIVDTMTGKDIVREFNRDIDSIDKIAERMAVKKRRILLKMKKSNDFSTLWRNNSDESWK
jgi:hypothetical protein